MPEAPRWTRARVGVRVASALSAAAVVAVALVVAGASLVFLVGLSLRTTVEETATQRAAQVAERVSLNFGGDERKNAIDAINAVTAPDQLAQVVIDYSPETPGEGGVEVLDSTEALQDVPRMSELLPAEGRTVVLPDVRIGVADRGAVHAVLVATGTTTVGRTVAVLYAEPLGSVDAATDTVRFYLLFGVPILILVAGAATYGFAGRALRPVEAIRTQVAAMTEKDLAQRVPVPAARDEVGRLAQTMNAMIARLEDAQGVQRRFVADASHELRSPLATIGAGLELLQRDTSDPATVTALQGETARLGRLVDALLLLARADERGLRPRREEVDLDEVAEAERGRPGEHQVQAEVRAEPVRVIGDRGQLVRVLRNLVDNARRHARSRVLVTVVRDGASAVIEVSDDGLGVAVADRGRVFERFVRLDDARARSDGGSGLGLAIVAEVVAAHRGSVELAQTPGGGALFRVRLPAAAEVPVDAEPAGSGDEPGAAGAGVQRAVSTGGVDGASTIR
ncbi:MAG: HAMP domain-containing histidine kinase [Pseudonocardia sp.]|nr:HAMP domain-containing histidine kinase [Pseudonocardia sp.]